MDEVLGSVILHCRFPMAKRVKVNSEDVRISELLGDSSTLARDSRSRFNPKNHRRSRLCSIAHYLYQNRGDLIVGKTVPSYRMALEFEIQRCKGFRKALKCEEDLARAYASIRKGVWLWGESARMNSISLPSIFPHREKRQSYCV